MGAILSRGWGLGGGWGRVVDKLNKTQDGHYNKAWNPWTSWWRHQMETFSALLAIGAGNSTVPGELPAQRPVTRSFDVLFDLRPNKRLSKHSWGWWFETLSRSLCRHCNDFTKLIWYNAVARNPIHPSPAPLIDARWYWTSQRYMFGDIGTNFPGWYNCSHGDLFAKRYFRQAYFAYMRM